MSAFSAKKFFSFLNLKDGSVRGKLYLTILKGIGLGIILYMLLRPQYKTTQNSNPTFKGATIQNLNYTTYQNPIKPEKNKWISVNGNTESEYGLELGIKF